jgi:hypothetical protein
VEFGFALRANREILFGYVGDDLIVCVHVPLVSRSSQISTIRCPKGLWSTIIRSYWYQSIRRNKSSGRRGIWSSSGIKSLKAGVLHTK